MTPGRLVLVRHGETAWSRLFRHTGRTDIELTDAGREQARAAGAVLAAQGWDFGVVRVSPLVRARETAQLLGYPDAMIDDDLAEWDYGPVEGLTRDEVSREVGYPWSAGTHGVRVPAQRNGQDPALGVWGTISDEGEAPAEIAARMARVIERVTPDLYAGRDVLLVAHGHVVRVLTTVWLGLDVAFSERLALGTAAHCVLGFDRGVRSLIRWNIEPELPTTPKAPR